MNDKTIQLVNLLLPIAVTEIPKLVQFFMGLGTRGQETAAQIGGGGATETQGPPPRRGGWAKAGGSGWRPRGPGSRPGWGGGKL